MDVGFLFLVTAVLDIGGLHPHHKTRPVDLLVQSLACFTKRHLVAQRGITNPRQLVGQCTCRLVVIAS